MLLKHRVPLFYSFLFSLVLATVMLTIYFLFSNFRRVDFKDRLATKAETTMKLLLEVKEVDDQLLKIIDKNSINKLYNEKTVIINDSLQLIYSSIDDAKIVWKAEDLKKLKQQKEIYRHNDEYELLGLYFNVAGRDFYTFISAEDKYGISKLNYLKFLLIFAFLISTTLVWLISFFLSKRTLQPLDQLRRQMQEVTSKNLLLRVHEPKRRDEIKALSESFNQMLDRIEKAYKSQKDFTSNASHELRTPIARIAMQLENLIIGKDLEGDVKMTLQSALEDSHQLSDIISSLLLLSQIEDAKGGTVFQNVRLDEVIFKIASRISQLHPDFKFQFDIENQTSEDLTMEVSGDETLLEIAILNLFINAYSYSNDQTVKCVLTQEKNILKLVVVNSGEVPVEADTAALFNTFTRGRNVKNKIGSGIGLSIVQRILQYHQATIVYKMPDSNTNEIVVSFNQDPV
jgi:two-component system, OmpR family, sensor histidine kinase ArlS